MAVSLSLTSSPDQASALPEELCLDLPAFQGPMDVLLELIRKHEIDIFDIPIAFITTEYLAHLDTLGNLNLQVGGEWLEMAATLLYIKSKMLVPVDEESDDDHEGPDPRAELVERLLDYQMYKMVAEKLDVRPQLTRDVFLPASRAAEFREQFGRPKLREADVNDLMRALQRVIAKHKDNPNWTFEVTREKLTLRAIIIEIATLLENEPRIRFEALFDHAIISRHRVVTTFLALLEMTRLRMIKLFQAKISEEQLYIERAVIEIKEVSQTLDFPEI